MMDAALPTFDVALARFTEFLESNQVGRPTVRWIFREDVALRGRSLLVSCRLPRGARLVEEMYSRAVASGARGVMLHALGLDDEAVYCTIVVPISNDDAEERWIHGLKLSMLTSLLPVTTIEGSAWMKEARTQTPAQHAGLAEWFQSRSQKI